MSVIIFRGLPGTAKTTSARILKEIIHGPTSLLRTDEVRREITSRQELTYSDESRIKVYTEIGKRAGNLISYGTKVIIDATFEKRAYFQAVKFVIPTTAEIYIIETKCSKNLVRRRMKKREKEGKDESEAKFEQYLKLEKEYEEIPPSFILDTSKTRKIIKSQLEEFLLTH